MLLPDDKPAQPAPCPLTKRELQVLWLFSKSMKNKDVARNLNITYNTARTHRRNILSKLGANGKHGAIEIAKANNWWGYAEVLQGIV